MSDHDGPQSQPPQSDSGGWERDVFAAVDKAVADSAGAGAPSLIPISPIPFGKYVLVAQLGTSGVSHLLLAVARGDGGFRKLVVVKRLRPIFAAEPDRVTDFFSEARLGARVHHANIVQTLESGTHSGQPFMVLEHLEGQPLIRLLRRRAREGKHLPAQLLVFIAQQILSGLAYVHSLDDFDGQPMNLVLRDVSPSNVMITYGGGVKLLNFGVSTPVAGSTETSPSWQQGKFSYYAPEQVEGFADSRTDLYAVGVLLWEGLTGKPLFSAGSPAETLLRVQRGSIPPISRPDVPADLVAIVDKALQADPNKRWQDASEFRFALGQAAAENHWHFYGDDLADFMDEEFADLRDRYGVTLRQCVCDGMAELGRQPTPDPVSVVPEPRAKPEPTERFSRPRRTTSSYPPVKRATPTQKLPAIDPRILLMTVAIGVPLWLIAIALFVQFLR